MGWSVNPGETLPLLCNLVKTAGNTATFLKKRDCRFVLQEAALVSNAPLPVHVGGRGGTALSLKGFGGGTG